MVKLGLRKIYFIKMKEVQNQCLKLGFFRYSFRASNTDRKGIFILHFSSIEEIVNFFMKLYIVRVSVYRNQLELYEYQQIAPVDLTDDIGKKNMQVFVKKFSAIRRRYDTTKKFSPKFPNVKSVH